MNSKNNSDFPKFCQEFFSVYLPRDRGLSSETIAAYATTFRLLLRFIQKERNQGPDQLSISSLDTELIMAFLRDLVSGAKNSARTRNCRLAAINTFFRFVTLQAPQYAETAARVWAIPTLKPSITRQITYLTREEVGVILETVDQNTFFGRRTFALVRLAAEAGLRNSEIRGLRRENIFLGNNPYISLQGKGRKERAFPLLPAVKASLKAWLKEIPDEPKSIVFPNADGSMLSADAVAYAVEKHVAIGKTKCPSLARKHVTPHVLRHSAAMGMMHAGIPLPVISGFLGHEQIKTTMIYIHQSPEHSGEMLANVPPLAGKQGLKPLSDETMAYLLRLSSPTKIHDPRNGGRAATGDAAAA